MARQCQLHLLRLRRRPFGWAPGAQAGGQLGQHDAQHVSGGLLDVRVRRRRVRPGVLVRRRSPQLGGQQRRDSRVQHDRERVQHQLRGQLDSQVRWTQAPDAVLL